MEKTREEIVRQINDWVESGALVGKPSLGVSYGTIDRRIARGELFATSFEGIVATDERARDEFEALLDTGRVMDFRRLQARKGYKTLYSVFTACGEGKLARISGMGRRGILYID